MMRVKLMRKLFNLRYFFTYLFDRKIPFIKKLWIYLVFIYFISPIDLFPDPILGFGFIDDAVIFIFSFIKILNDLDKYAGQKNNNKPKNPSKGKVIDMDDYRI
jgi:uncharacterized membrane protein YkvA (DUF1232 family)